MSALVSPRTKRLYDALQAVRFEWRALRDNAPESEITAKSQVTTLLEEAIYYDMTRESKIRKLENEIRKKNKRLHAVASRGEGP